MRGWLYLVLYHPSPAWSAQAQTAAGLTDVWLLFMLFMRLGRSILVPPYCCLLLFMQLARSTLDNP